VISLLVLLPPRVPLSATLLLLLCCEAHEGLLLLLR
jgi:hypothetical protein